MTERVAGIAERAQHVRPRVGARGLAQRPLKLGGGDLRRALGTGLASGGDEDGDGPRVAGGQRGRQMRREDRWRRDPAPLQQARRGPVSRSPLDRGQAIGDSGPDEGMAELQRGRVGQHVCRNQRRRGRPRVVDGHPGERRRHLEVAAVAEDDDRIGDRTRSGRQRAHQPRDTTGDALRADGLQPRVPAAASEAEPAAVSVSTSSTSSALPPVASTTAETNSRTGAEPSRASDERRHRPRTERPGRQRRPARFRDDRLDLGARLPRQCGAGGRGDPDRQPFEAAHEVGEEPEARRIGPLKVIDDQQQAILKHRQVRDQPVQPMQDGEAVTPTARRGADRRRRQRRHALEQRLAPLGVSPDDGRLEQLPYDPEAVLALELTRLRAQDQPSGRLSPADRLGEQERLAGARGPFEHKDAPAAYERVDRRELGFALKQRLVHGRTRS